MPQIKGSHIDRADSDSYQEVLAMLWDQTMFYVEDINGLQTPLKLEKPSSRSSRYDAEFLYVITSDENEEVSKVGRSTNPKRRLKGLQTGSPYKLRIAYTYGVLTKQSCLSLESRVHMLLDRERLSGEWFNLPAEDIVPIIEDVTNKATITERVSF